MKNLPDKLLINLKILSKIEKNGRISRSYDGVITLEQEVFYQSVKRFISSDSRKQSITEINSIIDEADTTIRSLLNNKVLHSTTNIPEQLEFTRICEVLMLLKTELEGAKHGIENLKFTYQTDINTGTQLDMTLLKIKAIQRELEIKLPNLLGQIPDNMTSSIFIPHRPGSRTVSVSGIGSPESNSGSETGL